MLRIALLASLLPRSVVVVEAIGVGVSSAPLLPEEADALTSDVGGWNIPLESRP